jgi:peptide/nickel transport system ATP-binding protein
MKVDNKALLDVEHISINFNKSVVKKVVNDISFQLNEGEILGIVGESGSGKTMTALAIMDLLHKDAVVEGKINFKGKELLRLNKEDYRKMKGKEISMIFQEPMTSLNPLMTIGNQMDEMFIIHEPKIKRSDREDRVLKALDNAGLKDSKTVYGQYPHQLSGGMRQRVMIAMAMLLRPKILIADEPTTALDVTIQKKILELIKDLNKNYGTSVILISHDLGVVKTICNRVLVMKDGNIVEEGLISDIFSEPKEDYTKNLIHAMPSIQKGLVENKKISSYIEKTEEKSRDKSTDKAKHKVTNMTNDKTSSNTILEVTNLDVFYDDKNKKLFGKRYKKQVVKQVSLELSFGETLGIVGESGCGKSTLAKAIVGLNKNINGKIMLSNIRPQMVFQDPYGSLNPVKKIATILEEPLILSKVKDKNERKKRVEEILGEVGLTKEHGTRYISELSGGQRQRVAIGVALIQNSKLIVLDEPVSALDVTVQAQILELLKKLQRKHELSYLFISHDLNVVYQMCNRVCVMYQGEIIETGSLDDIYNNPKEEYTKQLLDSVL